VKITTPGIYLVSRPEIDWLEIIDYIKEVGGEEWPSEKFNSFNPTGEDLTEFGGRLCYRSWKPGLNPNVRKVRKDGYLYHILESGHGSVLEHANYGFVFHNVSRVFTHELVRHRAGVAISQESMRFVRLTDIPMWIPDWAKKDSDLMLMVRVLVRNMEEMQQYMTEHFGLDEPSVPFAEKKAKTSFMRRFAPEGISTDIMWTANVRTLRHVIEARTDPGAEEEIRMVFGEVAKTMINECPELFGDFEELCLPDGSKQWKPKFRKV
jgi:thymidylate synthase (FAD)